MYKLSQLLSHYYWQENIKKENPAPNNEEQKAAVLIMSPVEELWLVFRTATGNRVSVWTQESFQNRFQKFFKSRLRMIVRVIVVPVVDNDWRFDNLCRGRLRQIHLQNLPEIALSLLFFNIPAGMSVSLPFVLNQKSHLIDMHACNHCSANSRAQTCWAGAPA